MRCASNPYPIKLFGKKLEQKTGVWGIFPIRFADSPFGDDTSRERLPSMILFMKAQRKEQNLPLSFKYTYLLCNDCARRLGNIRNVYESAGMNDVLTEGLKVLR